MSYTCNGYTACPSCGIGCNYECSSSTTEWGVCEEVPRGALIGGGGGRFPRGGYRGHITPTSSPNPNWKFGRGGGLRRPSNYGRRMRALMRRGGAWGGVPIPFPTNPHPRYTDNCNCGSACSGVSSGDCYRCCANIRPASRGIGGGRGRGGQGFGRGLSQSNIRARYGLGFRG